MDVSAPYRAVIPSLDGHVLMALARLATPVTGRHLHRLTGAGSEAGVRKVLARLDEHGLVIVTKAGSALLYQANRAHIAWPAVVALSNLRSELLARIEREIEGWPAQPRSIAIFGSAARGDGGSSSDIDVAVIRRRDAQPDDDWHAQLDRLRERITEWTGNRCQVYELSADELEQHIAAGEPIIDEWRRDAVTVAGADLRRLLADLAFGRRR